MHQVTDYTALHKRAKAILAAHGDMLQDQRRSDDLVFLNAMVCKRMVWGNESHQKRMDEIEAELDPDVSGCIKSNRA